MESILNIVKKDMQQAMQQAFPDLSSNQIFKNLNITPSTQEKFGHYQCNSAMKIAKLIDTPSRIVAEKIVNALKMQEKSIERFEKVDIAGSGFINLFLSKELTAKKIESIAYSKNLGIPVLEKPQNILVEFSSPNVAKELHVGHLRSTIIGDCLAKLFENLGHHVLRINHVGDWGTPFGMLIMHIKQVAPHYLSGKTATLSELVTWYKESKIRFDADAEFKKQAQKPVVELQSGDAGILSIWKIICEISRKAYQEICDILDVTIIERGESFYNHLLPILIDDLQQKNIITLSNGAKCIFSEKFKNREEDLLAYIVQKSDGGYSYDTTDLAAMRQRIEEEKSDRIIITADAGQTLHFQMLAAAAEKAGYLDPEKVRFDFVPFGLVLKSDGKKFQTRSGQTEKLIDLLTLAVSKAKEILSMRNQDMPSDQLDKTAKALGIGAVKYADLSCNRTNDYIFSYDKMLRFEGNTAAFLMYSYVRIEGIKRKIGKDLFNLQKGVSICLTHPSEISLCVHLQRFVEILEDVAQSLAPHRLADYLFSLANKFNAFFRDCRVEGSQWEDSRLLLCDVTSRTFKKGFEILGIQIVDRM